ncbi:MAG: 50S ribosomal protein L23 [Deltaproteobacteria bacterium]|nr:50S ribosomal protein L23 [Candidatus Zymogenaceae bacterium]
MKKYYDIILEPIITEKSNIQKEEAQQVTFKVPVHVTKIQVRQAVEKIFGKKVVDVHTIKMKGKVKRLGRFMGKRPDWKKAIVKLKPGERIDFFEGV